MVDLKKIQELGYQSPLKEEAQGKIENRTTLKIHTHKM